MKHLLSELNIKVRENKPEIDMVNLYDVWIENRTLQIFILSRGCRFSKLGMCTMCDYGIASRNLTLHETAIAMNHIIKKITPDIRAIGLGSLGSFFDPYEIPEENKLYILKTLARLDIQDITIETYYNTITEDNLKEAKSILSGKSLSFELGLESADSYIQKFCLNKVIHLPTLQAKIDLVHKFECTVILNILFGVPFLNMEQQIQDTLKSIMWGFDHGADMIALFPVNIKPYTLLNDLYYGGFYTPVSQWGFIMLLNEIPEKYLDQITFSWYGNRKSNYAKNETDHIMPRACNECNPIILAFYDKFLELSTAAERKDLLRELLKKPFTCNCRENELIRRTTDTYNPSQRNEALQYLGNKYHVL